jgi:membrane fusion protein, multidrug efflux system
VAAAATTTSTEAGRNVEVEGATAAVTEPAKARPARARVVLFGMIALAAASVGGFYLYGLGKESTDDAQIEGRVMSVSPRVTGQVVKVVVKDNQEVNEGDLLVELDARELEARAAAARADLLAAKAGLASAQAQLDLTERNGDAALRQARGGLTQAASSVTVSRSSIDQAQADVAAAESRTKLAQTEYDRVVRLHAENAVSQAEVDTRGAALDQAKASLALAVARLDSTRASLTGSAGGVTLAQGRLAQAETIPQQVQAARAAVDLADARVKQSEAALVLADLNVSYTKIKAPAHGVVSRRTVEVGQIIGPDRPLMAVVPLDDVWVVANFKENQLRDMRPGEAAKVEVDTYGGKVARGHVESIAGASGARFSLLPPDNASGNYIKVVQRVPILVRIDDAAGMTLRPGMSVEVTVDTKVH